VEMEGDGRRWGGREEKKRDWPGLWIVHALRYKVRLVYSVVFPVTFLHPNHESIGNVG
jgi:hypothetical protein